jgi:ferrochelatase
LTEAAGAGKPRLLLSAHGLPKKVVEAGDPYQWQVERTAAAIAEAVSGRLSGPVPLDWVVCYQSRVGPLEWIGPYTDAEIVRAGREGVPLVVAPIAFVSEHSETLVELDVEYRSLAEETGVPLYLRVPAVGAGPSFVGGLADLVAAALDGQAELCSGAGGRICPPQASGCVLAVR